MQLGGVTPSGISASWDVSALALDGVNAGTANLTLAVDPGLARGTYGVFIPGGTYAGNAGYFFVTVTPNTVPDFVLSAITPVSVAAGQAVAFSARVVPVAGFGGAVTVSSPGVAGAVGLTFAPNITGLLTGSGQVVTGTVATFASTPSCGQPYMVPVTAVSGGITHSGTVSVMVRGGPAPGFTVSAPDVTVTQGTTGTVPVTVNSSACFSGVATYSAATVGGVQMSPPAGTLAVNGVGSAVAGFSFFAPLSMAPGTYSGTATVSFGGISHAAAFSVKVVPNTTPYYTFTPFNSAPLVPGGSVTRYFVVQKQNGYNGVPVFSVNPAFLPAGISVVFSDGGKATYGTATATISAANTVVPNNGFSIPVDSSDGALSVSFPVGVQIVAAPLGVTYSVAYSKTAQGISATLTPKIKGGTPPFTVTGTGLGSQSGNTFTTNGAADAVGTLTVTDTSGAVVAIAATIPAAPVVPDAVLASMAMRRIGALEDFASSLVAQGRSDAALRSAFLASMRVSAGDYAGLKNVAMQYRSARAASKAGAGLALKPLLAKGYTPENAPVALAEAAALRTYYSQALGLAGAWAPQFSVLPGAAAMKAAIIGPAGPDGGVGTGCDECGYVRLYTTADVQMDPGSGLVLASAEAELDFTGPADPALTLSTQVDGFLSGPTNPLGSGYGRDTCGPGCAEIYVSGQASATGDYVFSATGTGVVTDQNTGLDETRTRPAYGTKTWDASSCVPSVSSISVDGAGRNAFVAGAAGTAVVSGTCLLGVSGASVSGLPGLSVTLGTVGFGSVQLRYGPAAGTAAASGASTGSVVLSAGSLMLPAVAMVVPSLPYITGLTPGVWQSGSTVAFTITGVGFGASPGVSLAFGNLGAVTPIVCGIGQVCTDSVIHGSVVIPAEGSPDQATVSVAFRGIQVGNGLLAAPQEPVGSQAVADVQVSALTLTIDGIQVSQPPTPDAATGLPPITFAGQYSNKNSSFATASDTASLDLAVLKDAGAVTLTVQNLQPDSGASQIRWRIDRDPTDTVDTGVPALSSTVGSSVNFLPSTAGNFRLIAFEDNNRNGGFDEGEQLAVVRLAVVRTTLLPGGDAIFSTRNNTPLPLPQLDPLYVGITTATSAAIAGAPMVVGVEILIEGGGPTRTIGTAKVSVGVVGNLQADTFVVSYPGSVGANGTEIPGGPLPMLDTGRVAVNQPASGGASAFRDTLQVTTLPPPASGGLARRIISADAPTFRWLRSHPTTGDAWDSAAGSNAFTEFVVGFSDSFPRTYLPFSRANWQVSLNGGVTTGWASSTISGNGSLQPIGGADKLQAIGLSFARQHSMIYKP